MERVLSNLHQKLCLFWLRSTSHQSRSIAERTLLVLAVCGFGALWIAHLSFVYRMTPAYYTKNQLEAVTSRSLKLNSANVNTTWLKHNIPMRCLESIPGFSRDFDILHLRVYDETVLKTNIVDAAATLRSISWQAEPVNDYRQRGGETPQESQRLEQTCDKTHCNFDEYTEKRTDLEALTKSLSISFSYSDIEGYLLLPSNICNERNLTIQHVLVSQTDSNCFGEPFLQQLVPWIGKDTVMINWFLALQQENQNAYLYNPRSNEMVDLQHFWTASKILQPPSFIDNNKIFYFCYRQCISKIAVVFKTTFLYFVTTTLVSFTLRETQSRMLDFTQQLQQHVRSHQSVVKLVTTHLSETLVFVPGLVGMIFFLIEFYRGDKLLAFLVVSLVWLCEVFSVISLRSAQSIQFFPKIFFLLFSLFHFYLFSFPFGFAYAALASTVCFMMHSMLFFWQRYELPAAVMEFGRQQAQQSDVSSPQNGSSNPASLTGERQLSTRSLLLPLEANFSTNRATSPRLTSITLRPRSGGRRQQQSSQPQHFEEEENQAQEYDLHPPVLWVRQNSLTSSHSSSSSVLFISEGTTGQRGVQINHCNNSVERTDRKPCDDCTDTNDEDIENESPHEPISLHLSQSTLNDDQRPESPLSSSPLSTHMSSSSAVLGWDSSSTALVAPLLQQHILVDGETVSNVELKAAETTCKYGVIGVDASPLPEYVTQKAWI